MDSYNSFEESDFPMAGVDFQNSCNLGLHDFRLLLSVESLGTAKHSLELQGIRMNY